MVTMRSSALWLVLVGTGLAAVVELGVACAKPGHEVPVFEAGAEGGAGSGGNGGGGGSGGAADGGQGCAPPALGTSLFSAACTPGAPTVDWSPVRRISRVEYDNMVRDLLGDTTQPATNFSPESPMANGVNFQTNAPNSAPSVDETILQQYVTAAENLAQTAASSANFNSVLTLNGITPCATQNDACAQQFINAFANRAFRGQLDTTEAADLLAVYQYVADGTGPTPMGAPTTATAFGFMTGIQAVITAVLESSHFLYVLEFGDGTSTGGVTPLSSYEIAGRLGLFLWRSVPDAALMSAAASNSLTSVAAIQAQATRMLADPKANGAINDFTTQWVELQSTPSLGKNVEYGNWTTTTGEEMLDETLTNVSQLVLVANGSLTTLLTSPSSYINAGLATFYGTTVGSGTSVKVNDPALTGATPPVSAQFVSTTLPNRAGILTNGSIMATQAHATLPSSVLRGKLVREDVLCDPIPAPPPNVPPAPTAPSADAGVTTRDQFFQHMNITTTCYGCHQYMDWIGFGFGNFDATGAWQATDANGYGGEGGVTFPPIDATGKILPMNQGELSVPSFDGVTGTTGLPAQLAGTTQVDECYALQEFRYALTRIETAADACSVQQIYSAFTGNSLNIQKLLVAITGTDAFRYRTAEVVASECLTGSSCQ
jgi:hypothetical protein